MDLLETILRTVNAEQYLEHFRREGIEPRSLKLLTEEDLELLGIDDENARKSILIQSQNLLCATEEKIDTNVNRDYIKIVLSQTIYQLNLYNATLNCITRRPDILNCDIKLGKASNALHTAINELQAEINQLKSSFVLERGINVDKSSKKQIIIKGVLVLSSIFVLSNLYLLKKHVF